MSRATIRTNRNTRKPSTGKRKTKAKEPLEPLFVEALGDVEELRAMWAALARMLFEFVPDVGPDPVAINRVHAEFFRAVTAQANFDKHGEARMPVSRTAQAWRIAATRWREIAERYPSGTARTRDWLDANRLHAEALALDGGGE